MTGLVSHRDLKPGEKLRVWRRRLKLTRSGAAELLKRSVNWIGEVERDNRPEVALGDIPWTGQRDLKPHEKCAIYRLRSGITQGKIADSLQCSRLWVNKMERGEVNCDDLLWYWEQ